MKRCKAHYYKEWIDEKGDVWRVCIKCNRSERKAKVIKKKRI